MSKRAPTLFPVIDAVAERWSPRAFADRAVSATDLRGVFEAGRWAPSAFNAQPWRFLVASRVDDPEGYARLAGLLNDGNAWAKAAPVLALAAADTRSDRGGMNRWAHHDLGLAMGAMLAEATARGLVAHPMAGFDRHAAPQVLGLPHGVDPVAMLAIGHLGDADALPEDLRARERSPRRRKSQDTTVFSARWDAPLQTADDHHRILEAWFGDLDVDGLADAAHVQRWWAKDPSFDDELRERFGATHAAVAAGEREAWLETPQGRLAAVIVLDQLSRNLFRDTPGMYAHDATALRWALDGIDAGEDRTLPTHMRCFLYMPLMHAEDVAIQDRCVALFTALVDELAGPARAAVEVNLRFAIAHRDIVARFGRFPHRNRILGRASTPEEEAFLKEPGSSF